MLPNPITDLPPILGPMTGVLPAIFGSMLGMRDWMLRLGDRMMLWA
jgi:hypothetical protein